jgi:hypothetical protein
MFVTDMSLSLINMYLQLVKIDIQIAFPFFLSVI